MAHKRTQKQLLSNVILDGQPFGVHGLDGSVIASDIRTEIKAGALSMVEIQGSGVVVDLADLGAAGGVGVIPVFNFPASQLFIYQATFLVDVTAVGGGVSATATCAFASGTSPIVDSTPSGAEANITANSTGSLTAGAGSFRGLASVVGTQFDNTGGTAEWNLGFSCNDASISGAGTMTVDVFGRMFYLDMSDGQ